MKTQPFLQTKIYIAGFLSCLCLASLFPGCANSDDNGKIVAEAFNNKLYEKDLKDIVPEGIAPEDSIILIKNYIRQWSEQNVILEKARKNVDTAIFAKKLEDYKNALIIYEYEQQIVNQLLDTNVSDSEMEQYYTENSANFLLKDNIVKVLYVKLDKKSQNINAVKKIIFKPSLNEGDVMALQKEAYQSAVNFYLDSQTWLLFNDLLKEMPIETYNQELFLKHNRNVNMEDENFVYYARIMDFKTKETISPFSLEKDNIKAIIINKRKVGLIEKMHQDLMREAETKEHIKTYIP